MAGYRNISVSFWTDSKVDDDFTPEDKYFYLYLMTNPHTSLCGCYEISMKQMERETGYNTDTVKRLLSRMEEMHGVIRYSATTKEVLILNWWKYNWSSSSKVKNAVVSVAEHIKHEPFKRYVMDRVSIRYGYGMDTTDTESVSDTVSDTETDTVSDTETDTVSESKTEHREAAKPQRERFTPPSIEEVTEYCRERKNGIDAQAFIDFYESKGWIVGKQKMKDWRAAVRNWENRRKSEMPKQAEQHQSSIPKSELDLLFGGV